jgi:hypothetical protein
VKQVGIVVRVRESCGAEDNGIRTGQPVEQKRLAYDTSQLVTIAPQVPVVIYAIRYAHAIEACAQIQEDSMLARNIALTTNEPTNHAPWKPVAREPAVVFGLGVKQVQWLHVNVAALRDGRNDAAPRCKRRAAFQPRSLAVI